MVRSIPETTEGTGALLNPIDSRDVHIAQVVAEARHPEKNITDISALPVENQLALGTCVGQSEGKGREWDEYKESNKLTRLSKRALYRACKLVDGYNGEGTYPRTAAKILKDYGIPTEDLVRDINNLSHEAYLSIDVYTDERKQSASAYRIGGYAFCYTLNDLKTAIDEKGTMNATVQVGDWPSNGKDIRPKPNRGFHRILIYGYEDFGTDTKIYFRNSWGEEWGDNGNGWFMWSDYENFVFDMMVYTDVPNEIIEYVKQTPFAFTRTLKLGMSGEDVKQLQMRLAKEVAEDGSPCYRYTDGGTLYFGTYFGTNTRDAVKRYQILKGIVSSGTEETTGFGMLGPKTRNSLNGIENVNQKSELCADAIQEFEGWYPGSRSYRNKNPGNIRFVGQALAIGEDRGNVPAGTNGYCIFKTYADGRYTLMQQIRNVALGKSATYNRGAVKLGLANGGELSIQQYFRIYAPTSDNNYPDIYAAYVAKKMGVPVTTKMKTLV